MPQAEKSTISAASQSPYTSLEGQVFEASSVEKLAESLALAIDYRGDVTLELNDDTSIEGFIYRVDEENNPSTQKLQPTLVYLFVKTGAKTSEPMTIEAQRIRTISFTGEDTAFGKSWDEWTTKSQAQKQKEAETQRKRAEELGHL